VTTHYFISYLKKWKLFNIFGLLVIHLNSLVLACPKNREDVTIKQSETGVKTEEICRKMGISQATFFNWKKKFGGLGLSELRKLKQLEEENNQLKKLVAELILDKQMLQDVIKKKL
jgi:putative transposase